MLTHRITEGNGVSRCIQRECFSCEASTIGFKPGEWPSAIIAFFVVKPGQAPTEFYMKKSYAMIEEGTKLLGYVYESTRGTAQLTVFND